MEAFFNNYYANTNLIPTDIYPMQYGEQQCEPGHAFGPCVRNNYLIHYIYNGKGIFKTDGKEYHLHKGQFFLICPEQLTYYKADTEEPWLYRWIEFNGSFADSVLKSAGLSEDSPIFTDGEDMPVGNALLDIVRRQNADFEILMSLFWRFIYAITNGSENASQKPAEEYINLAEGYIKMNAYKRVTVNDVAAYIGIDRSYLCRLFKEYKNVSPQEFIMTLKLNMACRYLENKNLSISEVAQSIGYNDTHVFSKAFKKQFKVSPMAWRKQLDWEHSIKEYK